MVYPTVGVLALLASAALWASVLMYERPVPIPYPEPWVVFALAGAFVIGEVFPLRFEIRSKTLLVSLSEAPLVIAVVLLPAWIIGTVYLTASVLVFVVRRDSGRASVINAAMVLLESGVALAVMALFDIPPVTGDLLAAAEPRLLPAAAGVLLGALVSVTVVSATFHYLGVSNQTWRMVGQSTITAVVVVGIALAGLVTWNAVPAGPVLSLALLLTAIWLYRTLAGFLRQHADLVELYGFGRSVAAASGDIVNWRGLIGQVCQYLNASIAVLYLTDRPGKSRVLATTQDGPLTVTMPPQDDPLFVAALRDGGARAVNPGEDGAFRAALAARGCREVIVVPLQSGERHRGYLEVRDRRSRWNRFGDDDLTLLQTLGGHLATALDNHRLVSRLTHEAYHDTVTGLYNRSGFDQQIQERARGGDLGGVLLVELDVLRGVTSALGYEHGEDLLVAASQRIVDQVGPLRPVAHIDAERFAVIVEPQPLAEMECLADRILAAVSRPIAVEGMEVEPVAIVGIVRFDPTDDPHTAPAPHALLQRAQLALQAAISRDEPVAVYQPAIGEIYHRRFQLVSQFRRAVDTGRITVHFQPKLTLTDRELIGVEALVRWMHPEYGFVSPAELIDAIENTSAIDLLFRHVLDQSLAQVATWHARGMRIAVAVNMSTRNLRAADLTRTVSEALQRHDVAPDLLTLEITESSVMQQPERTLPILRELHTLGIQLSVDDFGTGYSSLAYLRRLPIDEIKIDRSFVQGMITDLGDMAIVRAIIDLGHSMGLRVVAEGVEEEAGRDALRSMRCDAMQGFLLARPLPIDRFDAWVASRTEPVEPAVGSAVALQMKV